MELLKKFWFVVLIGVILTGFVIYYGVDVAKTNAANKINVTEKVTADGNSVIYSIDGKEYTSADLAADLDGQMSTVLKLYAFEREVTNTVKATDEMTQQATNGTSYYKQQYDEETLEAEATLFGFPGKNGIYDLLMMQLKSAALAKDYLANHEEVAKDYFNEHNPKLVSHILIKVADVTEVTDEEGNVTHVANPTAEETAKLNEALELLKTEDFSTVAATYSDDGSASNGGSLGYVDDAVLANYVKEFAETVESLNNTGDVSEVITTTYGYHIIKIDKAGFEDMISTDEFTDQLINADGKVLYTAIFEKAALENIAFANPEDEAAVRAYCGLEAK